MEILDAYDCCELELSGNATHLAPWHAKLGFRPDPFIATLHSLTVDGGLVPFMHLVVEKVSLLLLAHLLAEEVTCLDRCIPWAILSTCRNQSRAAREDQLDLGMRPMKWLSKRSGRYGIVGLQNDGC